MLSATVIDYPPTGLKMKEALAIIDALNPEAFGRYDWSKLRFLLSKLMGAKFFPSFIDTPLRPMIRGRAIPTQQAGRHERVLAGDLLTSLSEFGPLPSERVTSYGRCHLPGSPVFYAAFNDDTVLAEIKPEANSLVYLISCIPKPGVQFKSVTVGEIDYIRRYGRSSIFGNNPMVQEIQSWLGAVHTEDHYVRLVTDAFLASLLSRKASSQDDYKLTSALCGMLLELECDFPGSAEAIYYPSVAHQGGINIALTQKCYAEKVSVTSCKVVHVVNNFGFGIYKTRTIAKSKAIDEQGNVTWDPTGESIEEFARHIIRL